jgi:MOSC domain-containing protein YiiM
MSVVLRSGVVRPGDHVEVVLPPEPHRALDKV